MKKLKNFTVEQYLSALASRQPAPGGGSAAALTGALGAGLLSMVAQYSIGKGKPPTIEKRLKATLKTTEALRLKLLRLVDLDAEAYLKVVQSKNKPPKIKQKVLREAEAVPKEICRACQQAIHLAPLLAKEGNFYLLGDTKAGVELLFASFSAASAFTKQS